MSQQNQKRRDFIKQGLGVAASALFLKLALFGDSLAWATTKKKKKKPEESDKTGSKSCDPPLVELTNGQAVAVKYVHDKAKADATIKIARAGTPFAKQFCNNCIFYTEAGLCQGKKTGRCQLIEQGKVAVMAEGICGSWAPKSKS